MNWKVGDKAKINKNGVWAWTSGKVVTIVQEKHKDENGLIYFVFNGDDKDWYPIDEKNIQQLTKLEKVMN